MYSKTSIFNLSLSALLLSRQVVNADTDKSNEAVVLRTHWDTAWSSTLQDLDLDSTSSTATLELIEEDPNDFWSYSYKYPQDCVFLRRIQSRFDIDNKETFVDKRVSIKDGKKVIFTNQANAVVDYISSVVDVGHLSPPAAMALAYRLADLSSPLIVGKGANKLREDLRARYLLSKAEAQRHDQLENFRFTDEQLEFEFVRARLE